MMHMNDSITTPIQFVGARKLQNGGVILLSTETSQGCTKTLQGNPKLSGTADNNGQQQGSMRTWLKL